MKYAKTVSWKEMKLIDLIMLPFLVIPFVLVTVLKIIIHRGVKYEKNEVQNPKATFKNSDTDII